MSRSPSPTNSPRGFHSTPPVTSPNEFQTCMLVQLREKSTFPIFEIRTKIMRFWEVRNLSLSENLHIIRNSEPLKTLYCELHHKIDTLLETLNLLEEDQALENFDEKYQDLCLASELLKNKSIDLPYLIRKETLERELLPTTFPLLQAQLKKLSQLQSDELMQWNTLYQQHEQFLLYTGYAAKLLEAANSAMKKLTISFSEQGAIQKKYGSFLKTHKSLVFLACQSNTSIKTLEYMHKKATSELVTLQCDIENFNTQKAMQKNTKGNILTSISTFFSSLGKKRPENKSVDLSRDTTHENPRF